MSARVFSNFSSRRDSVDTEPNSSTMPFTSRVESRLSKQMDEAEFLLVEGQMDFCDSSSKVKESERFDVLVQSPHINTETKTHRRLRLHIDMNQATGIENRSLPQKYSKSAVESSKRLHDDYKLKKVHDDYQQKQVRLGFTGNLHTQQITKKSTACDEPSRISPCLLNLNSIMVFREGYCVSPQD